MTRFPSLRHWTIPLAALLTLLLASCGVQEPVSVSAPDDTIAHVLTIDIGADADAAELASAYDAQVLSFHPDAGFAILGLRAGADRMFPQAESNEDALAVAEAHGFSAWAGGVSAWAGGVSAWAGGVSAWAGGASNNPFPENVDYWISMDLDEAHEDSLDLGAPLGAGITVAVLDTGVDVDHIGLTGKLTPSTSWYDYVDGDTNPDEVDGGDYYGHGTAVAGIVLQVAPQATILPLRVLDSDGRGDLSDVVLAVERALEYGADVINLSLGSNQSLAALEAILQLTDAAGVPVTVSVGNNDGAVLYPAAYATNLDLAIAVGSIDDRNRKSSFSAFGPEVSLVAHGEGIASLYPDDGTVLVTGTSFAAPFAAGAAAYALSELQASSLGSSDKSALRAQLGSLLHDSGTMWIYNHNDSQYQGALGGGRLDFEELMKDLRDEIDDLR